MGQWGKFRVKNAAFVYINFFGIVLLFSSKYLCFVIFISYFYEASNFHNNINKSKIGIGDKKLSVELYAE